MEHASFSPSSLYRVIACPASWSVVNTIQAQKGPAPPSPYAEHGTLLHAVVVEKAKGDILPYNRLDVEDRNYIDDAMDFISVLQGQMGDGWQEVHDVRVKLDGYSNMLENVWGTLDYALWDDSTLHIVDWKFGKGVQVYAHRNPQLLTYAAGMMVDLPDSVEKVFCHIVQPPLNHFDVYETTRQGILNFLFSTLLPTIQAAQKKNPRFHAGEKQCRFCPAGVQCPERHKMAITQAQEVFKKVQVLEVVSPEDLSAFLSKCGELTNYIKQLKKYALDQAIQGEPLPGWKVVSGRSTRKWKDERQAAEFLSDFIDDCLVTKVITPAQAEKKYRQFRKDKGFQALVEKTQGKPVLAPESDKREEYLTDVFRSVDLQT